MSRKLETVPVIFRADRSGDFKGSITAVFPTGEANPGNLVCYAHVGQHGECSLDWYRSTRPAKPHEYEPLLRELQGIYGREPDAVQLVVYKRMTGKASRR
jgi:hypothetical protein